jgi:hypothetical protein
MQGSAPSLNPLPDVSDEGVADDIPIRNRDVCSPKTLPMVVVSRCALPVGIAPFLVDRTGGMGQSPGMARNINPGAEYLRAVGDGVVKIPQRAAL